MSIGLNPNQEQFIQTKLQAEKHYSAEEIFEIAIRLLDEDDRLRCSQAERTDTAWVKDVQQKIDAAISALAHPINGETFVNEILERFHKLANQARELIH